MSEKDIALEIRNVVKNYGNIRALQDISLTVRKGEIHALLGENGAGKSTLIKIISGEISPTEGTVIINGKEITAFHPTISRGMGVAVVHQELSVFENMTVYENIFPYAVGKKTFIPKKKLIEEAQKSIERFGLNITPTEKVSNLTASAQQMVEILRALSENANIILLDEPTSGLNAKETESLMRILRQLRQEGISIIYISHRIAEIVQISDCVSVLRDGCYMGTFTNDESLTEHMLISHMVGRDFEKSIYAKKVSTIKDDTSIAFEVKNFTSKRGIEDVSFSVRKGEILGVVGLEGSGTAELSRMLFGLQSREKGEIYFEGNKISHINPTEMIRHGIMYLSNNRKDMGLYFNMSIMDNVVTPSLDNMISGGLLSEHKMQEYTLEFVKEFSIVLDSIYDKPGSMSGGNQQKAMLSICLGVHPKVIIINEPTRGIDVGAKLEILQFLERLAKEGCTILCFSSDLPEIITLSDRVLIMNSGKTAGIIECDEISETSIMHLAVMDMKERAAWKENS